ncbi:hypothetical protein GCM10020295_71810 [Streptomyces cinereospinus]
MHHVVAADQPVAGAPLRRAQRPQGARDGPVAAAVSPAGVADPDPGDAGAVGLRAHPAHVLPDQPGGRGEVGAHGVLDDPGLLAVAGEHDTLLVQEFGGVVRTHRERDVGHRALDVVELLAETLWCHGRVLPLEHWSPTRAAGPLIDTETNRCGTVPGPLPSEG